MFVVCGIYNEDILKSRILQIFYCRGNYNGAIFTTS